MKAVILAGGLGTRLSEETDLKPKPMVDIGGMPILWHIMKIYAYHGVTDFVICLGYKGYYIKEFFYNYFLHSADLTINLSDNTIHHHNSKAEPWKVTLVDTGQDTMTGGRLKNVRSYLDADTPFCLTYGDGVANIDIRRLIDFHKGHGKEATLSAVVPPGRYGALDLDRDQVRRFIEKPPGDNVYINGGFFVLNPSVIDRIEGDATHWEAAPLEGLARDGQLCAYRHPGFWHAMDTLRDRRVLEDLWARGTAPWKVWA